MFKRVPQPPVNPATRALERHDFWPGFAATLVGLIIVFCGARHLTSVGTKDGDKAWETQLVRAFSSGGLQYPSQVPPPPPPRLEDPAAQAQALERWAKQQRANQEAPTWKVRVDVSAKTPCPT
jgi:hypothetical protein